MKRAFTLVELLTVMGLFGFLGSAVVVAGVSMARGRADRAAEAALEEFLTAVEGVTVSEGVRTSVHFRTHRLEQDDEYAPAVRCRAVAVKASGRVSHLADGHPWDEFADEGPVQLDGQSDVFPLADGPWRTGVPYGRVFAVLELPADYEVPDGTVSFLPVPGERPRRIGSAKLKGGRL